MWRDDETDQVIHELLCCQVRERARRLEHPILVVLDTQAFMRLLGSLPHDRSGPGETGAGRRKRGLAVDMVGLVIAVAVLAANRILAVSNEVIGSAGPAVWHGSPEPFGSAGEVGDVRCDEQGDRERMRARIRAGDREAFAALYEEYARAVYNHAYRLSGDWSTAEEVLSETFLAAWRTRHAVEPEGDSLRPWLLGIATNKARNANRGTGRRLAFLARHTAPEPVADIADATVGRIDDTRRLAAVRQALGGLRRKEREVLVLCVWSGLDYAEAAKALGIPVGTVRSRLSRARTRLRRLTDGELGRTPEGPAREARLGEAVRSGREPRPSGREPRPGRGEVESRAAFVALPIQEEAR